MLHCHRISGWDLGLVEGDRSRERMSRYKAVGEAHCAMSMKI